MENFLFYESQTLIKSDKNKTLKKYIFTNTQKRKKQKMKTISLIYNEKTLRKC